ncbi:MAG: sulfite exporter TauE/SafE family protein, partial [Myxococcales bacterium]|nr:sulfite exporter TauE/SafE family protein [Myxococcales bacterium]
MIDPLHALLLVGGGAAAGFVNAFAGGGSALTVPLLMLTGMDARLANGTNRLAVWAQAWISAHAFHQKGVRPWPLTARAAAPALAGALLGALLATRISPEGTRWGFGVVFLLLAATLAFRPDWLVPTGRPALERPGRSGWLALFGVGLYGGLFQAGVG